MIAQQGADGTHIGIAVDTERGLLVPVIRNVQDLTLQEVARRSRELIGAARRHEIQAEDLQGGVFTLSNLGGFGVEAFTPVINYPEIAILGLGAVRWEPLVLSSGHIVAREQMTLSLTFDHRVVDGAPAARFLATVAGWIDEPPAEVHCP
jgi:pyruvate dehydrogenase E2 component (dihydrolipoamide acetyltransferase)